MVQVFDNDETGYLRWIQSNPQGFVANIDRAHMVKHYPMVHTATHGLISSAKIGNYTTGKYIKVCSTDFDELQQYSQAYFGRPLTRCSSCM